MLQITRRSLEERRTRHSPGALRKKQVYLEGSIHYDEWTDKDGNKRNTTKIRVSGPQSRLVLLGSRGEGGAPGGGGPGGGGPGGGGGRGAAEKEQGGGPPADDFQVSDDDVPF